MLILRAMKVPIAPPARMRRSNKPWWLIDGIMRVEKIARAIPDIPNKLPLLEEEGLASPFSARIKHTAAIKYK
jgi:hypothetical protein